jgi:hypothetical protein
MRALLVVVSLLAASYAWAVDYRWTTSFAQGTVEAIIHNRNGSSINIYCPSGQTDTTPGMFIEVRRISPKAKEQVDVQIIVDGENHPFTLDESQFRAGGRAFRNALDALVDALAGSKAKTFKVEFPKHRTSETFSLRDARKALKSAKVFLADCE